MKSFQHDRVFKREHSIELFRILLMFGIVWLHVVNRGVFRYEFPAPFLISCVPGFMLISGYFGAHFRISKVLRLYATMLWCILLVILLGGQGWLEEFFRLLNAQNYGWWFLHAYVIVIALAPAVDRIMCMEGGDENGDRQRSLIFALPVLFIIFIWGWLSDYNFTMKFVPRVCGVQPYCFSTLLGSYIVGRLVKILRLRERISVGFAMCALVILLIAVAGGIYIGKGWLFYFYNCPIMVLLPLFSFCLMGRIRLPGVIEKGVERLAPSMFAVYLIHVVIYFPWMQRGSYVFIGWMLDICGGATVLGQFLCACAVFLISVMLDCPRRLLVLAYRKRIQAIEKKVDDALPQVSEWIIKKIGG